MKRATEPPATFEDWCAKHQLRCIVTPCNRVLGYEASLRALDERGAGASVGAFRGIGTQHDDATLTLMHKIRGQHFVVNEAAPYRREFSAPERWIHHVDIETYSRDQMREQLRVILQSCPVDCTVAGSVAGTAQNYIVELERTIDALKKRCELEFDGHRLPEED